MTAPAELHLVEPELPTVVVNNRQVRDIAEDAWAALLDSPFGERVFR